MTQNDKYSLGFWIYLMTDLIMFAALFAVYAVLQRNTFGGPNGEELFNLPFVLTETIILLTSSFTCGLAFLALQENNLKKIITWLSATFILGAAFLAMELSEFHHLIAEGNGPQRNAFLSSYFTLVGAHGIHIAVGLLWIAALIIIIKKRGLSPSLNNKLARLIMFWHFLDLVWIFIFTIVYLMGVL